MDARDAGKLARSGPAAALPPQEREGEGEEERKRRYAAAGSGREEAPRVSRGGRRRRSHRALTRPKSDPSSTPQRWRRGKERGEGRPPPFDLRSNGRYRGDVDGLAAREALPACVG